MPRGNKSFVTVCAVVILLGLMSAAPAAAATAKDVSARLACQCGCGMVLETCASAMPECGWAAPARQTIERLSDQGRTAEQIEAYFVKQYGEQVLAAPTKKGFNLTAWIIPFAALGAGLITVGLLVNLWVRRSAAEASGSAEVELDPEYLSRLQQEIDEFE